MKSDVVQSWIMNSQQMTKDENPKYPLRKKVYCHNIGQWYNGLLTRVETSTPMEYTAIIPLTWI